MRDLKLVALLVAWLCGITFAGAARAEDEQSIKAFAAWQGRGQMFETGPNRVTFVGSFTGMIFVETDKGPLDAGFMVCPAIAITIDSRFFSRWPSSRLAKDNCSCADRADCCAPII